MKLIIAGSRTIDDDSIVREALNESPFGWPWNGEIVSGGAGGVDEHAKNIAQSHVDIEYTEFEADWQEYGKAAGPKRNAAMAEYGDVLLAVWDGQSAGTKSMIRKATDAGIPMYVKVVDGE